MTTTIIARAEKLAAQGRATEGARLLAAADEPEAAFTLALWQLDGQHVPRDLAQSRNLFAQAARAGRSDALAIYIAFVANGTGGAADWPEAMRLLRAFAATDAAARDQLAIIAAMELAPDGAPAPVPPAEPISASPDVRRARALFTPAECAFLIRCAEPWLEPAMVIDPRTGHLVRDPVRTSDGAAFTLATANPAIHALNRRLAAVTGTDVTQGEPLQVLSYGPGQQYHPHHDAIAGMPNQRTWTVLVYLNDEYRGGETRFLTGGLATKGGTGDAILFRNTDAAGRPDPAARHAGLPVTSGRKLIASRWIRQRALDLGDKPGGALNASAGIASFSSGSGPA